MRQKLRGQTERQWNAPEFRCSRPVFRDTWGAVCMIYFVAMWNGHMRGRDGFTPYHQRRHGEDGPYRMYPWGSLVFAHLHKPVVEDEEESDRWRSKVTPCILVEVTNGPAGIWGRCYGVVPLFRFTGLNRPSVVHVRRCNDIDFPENVSYSLRQRLMVGLSQFLVLPLRRTVGHWQKRARTSRMKWSLQMAPGMIMPLCLS